MEAVKQTFAVKPQAGARRARVFAPGALRRAGAERRFSGDDGPRRAQGLERGRRSA